MEKKQKKETVISTAKIGNEVPRNLVMLTATFLDASSHQCFLATSKTNHGHLLSERSWCTEVEIPNAPLFVWGATTKAMLNPRTVSLHITYLKKTRAARTGNTPFVVGAVHCPISNAEMQARLLASPAFRRLSIVSHYPKALDHWTVSFRGLLQGGFENPDPNPKQDRELQLEGVEIDHSVIPWTALWFQGRPEGRATEFSCSIPESLTQLRLGPNLRITSDKQLPKSLRNLHLDIEDWDGMPCFTGGQLDHLMVKAANTAMFFAFCNLHFPRLMRVNYGMQSLRLEAAIDTAGFLTGHPDISTMQLIDKICAAIEFHLKPGADFTLRLTFDKSTDLFRTRNSCETWHRQWTRNKPIGSWRLVLAVGSQDKPLTWASSP